MRRRGGRNAADLLHLALLSGSGGWSLRPVAGHAGIGSRIHIGRLLASGSNLTSVDPGMVGVACRAVQPNMRPLPCLSLPEGDPGRSCGLVMGRQAADDADPLTYCRQVQPEAGSTRSRSSPESFELSGISPSSRIDRT